MSVNVFCPDCHHSRPILNPGACCPYCGYGGFEDPTDDNLPVDEKLDEIDIEDIEEEVDMSGYCCPECGGDIQVTAYRFLTMDRETGQLDTTELPELYAMYCENECFIVEDLTDEPEGKAAMDLIIDELDFTTVEVAEEQITSSTDIASDKQD